MNNDCWLEIRDLIRREQLRWPRDTSLSVIVVNKIRRPAAVVSRNSSLANRKPRILSAFANLNRNKIEISYDNLQAFYMFPASEWACQNCSILQQNGKLLICVDDDRAPINSSVATMKLKIYIYIYIYCILVIYFSSGGKRVIMKSASSLMDSIKLRKKSPTVHSRY
jgi:hypothetical protein